MQEALAPVLRELRDTKVTLLKVNAPHISSDIILTTYLMF